MNNPQNLREINREIVSALIFSLDEKLLMGMKDPKKGGVYSDCWHIPGGGVDNEEDLEEALRREIFEETNLNIKNSDIKLIDNNVRGATEKILKDTNEKVWCKMKFNIFRVDIDQKASDINLSPTDDLVKLKWFDVNELDQVKLTPPSIDLFKRLKFIN